MEGDSQAGFYSDIVYNQVLNHRDAIRNRCTLMRTTFEKALNNFEDRSIDIPY